MSYSGQDPAPCLIQGLSTSDIQDTWSDNRVTFTATNNVAALPAYYVGDWCLRVSNNGSSNYYANFKPYATAHRSEHGITEGWQGTTNFCGSETLVCARNDISFIQHYKSGSSAVRDYPGCSTICEIFV